MSELDEAVRRIAQAKAFIDNGMCRVGPTLDSRRADEEFLTAGASRAIALSDAVVSLCRQEHPTEALPVLRQLAETAVAMRWVAAADGPGRAAVLSAEAEGARWETLWPGERLRARALAARLEPAEVDAALAGAAEFAFGGRQSAPWSHVFAGRRLPESSPAELLHRAARWMGHVLKALDDRWPGFFPGAEALWEPA